MSQDRQAASEVDKIEQDRQLLVDAQAKGTGAKLMAYTKLSGPGWLQGAITLGGGSLAGSLYVGVIGGYEMLWLQPLMMIFGVVMLSVIAYVTLSTKRKPFGAINEHINPVLGWGWLIASLMANLVWAMPQFSLGTAALQQNLFPDLLGSPVEADAVDTGKYVCIAGLFVIGMVVVWFYDSGGWGIKLFEILLKIMVAIIVLSFFGVVIAMSVKGVLPWGEIFAGFIPDFSQLTSPGDQYTQLIAGSTDKAYWEAQVINTQQDRMVAAAATAVGINMTFLLPYSMLRKGWNKDFRGLATFDLSTGLFIPFVLATSCVVIAAAQQFHGKHEAWLVDASVKQPASTVKWEQKEYDKIRGRYKGNVAGFIKHRLKDEDEAAFKKLEADQKKHDAYKKTRKEELGKEFAKAAESDPKLGAGPLDQAVEARRDDVAKGDRQMAAVLVKRDASTLALSLTGLVGPGMARYVFGIGVVGMAISTIIILMLINGFCLTELLGAPSRGTVHRIGAALPGFTGALGFIWLWTDDQARFWLAVPTSRFGMILLPVAYITFFLMMNSKSLLGEHLKTGGKRVAINVLMLAAIVVATIGCGIAIWNTKMNIPGTEIMARWPVLIIVGVFILLAIIVHFVRPPKTAAAGATSAEPSESAPGGTAGEGSGGDSEDGASSE